MVLWVLTTFHNRAANEAAELEDIIMTDEDTKDEASTVLAAPVDVLVMRLKKLLPELNYAKETHRQWRDCDKKYRDENPDIGDSEFHAKYVDIYDERISAIEEAVTFLREQAA